MPALIATEFVGQVIYLGYMPALSQGTIVSAGLEEMNLDYKGNPIDAHYGETRPSCNRVRQQYSVGTEIRNVRQLSLVSSEEMDEIGTEIGLDYLDPMWLGASIVVKGIPDFSHIPPSSRLQSDSGMTLTVDMQNRPCLVVSKTIEQDCPGFGKSFKGAAKGKRGVTAWVERPGTLKIGDSLKLHIPDQRVWRP